MKTLYIERSTGNARDGAWTAALDLEDVSRIVVGLGPGSFAGVRAALAFAQGFAVGRPCEVLGLPSPCAVASSLRAAGRIDASADLAVVGDARRGLVWIARFEKGELVGDVFEVPAEELAATVGPSALVVSSDHARIGELLSSVFAARYLGEAIPTSEGLRLYAETFPAALRSEPLPIYLNPAVR